MAKAKFITDFERDCIRIGHARGVRPVQVARWLKRSRITVHKQIAAMRDAGTLDDLPMCFVVDEIAEAMRNA